MEWSFGKKEVIYQHRKYAFISRQIAIKIGKNKQKNGNPTKLTLLHKVFSDIKSIEKSKKKVFLLGIPSLKQMCAG